MAMHRRMSQKKFLAIWIPILAFVLALVIVGTLVMNYFSLSLDLFFGRGAAHAVPIEGTENWDTQYYTNEYGDTDKALKAAVDTARKAANEGIVLMKNGEGGGKPLLPLQEDAAVTPFGYRYMVPVWCPLGSASTHNGYGDFNHSNNYCDNLLLSHNLNYIIFISSPL